MSASDGPASPELNTEDLTGKTQQEIRDIARERGLVPFGKPTATGEYRKWRDPATGKERLRIDPGHVDPKTGLPYVDPRAAGPHVHDYDPTGKPIKDPEENNKHFPLKPDEAK